MRNTEVLEIIKCLFWLVVKLKIPRSLWLCEFNSRPGHHKIKSLGVLA